MPRKGMSTGAKAFIVLAIVGIFVVVGGIGLIALMPKGGVTPKVGHWSGSSPSVTFDIDSSGNLSNLKAFAPIPNGTCSWEPTHSLPVKNGKFTGDDTDFPISGHFTTTTQVEGTMQAKVTNFCYGPETKWSASWESD